MSPPQGISGLSVGGLNPVTLAMGLVGFKAISIRGPLLAMGEGML